MAELHFRLRSLPTLRVFERAPARLRSAHGKLVLAAQTAAGAKYRDYVDYYHSQAGDGSRRAIEVVWEAMCEMSAGKDWWVDADDVRWILDGLGQQSLSYDDVEATLLAARDGTRLPARFVQLYFLLMGFLLA